MKNLNDKPKMTHKFKYEDLKGKYTKIWRIKDFWEEYRS